MFWWINKELFFMVKLISLNGNQLSLPLSRGSIPQSIFVLLSNLSLFLNLKLLKERPFRPLWGTWRIPFLLSLLLQHSWKLLTIPTPTVEIFFQLQKLTSKFIMGSFNNVEYPTICWEKGNYVIHTHELGRQHHPSTYGLPFTLMQISEISIDLNC